MPHVFLSYAHAPEDAPVADWISAAFKQAGYAVWQDTSDLSAKTGEALNTEIATAITTADAFVCLISGHYFASNYCRAEAALAMEANRPIIDVSIADVAPPLSLAPLRSFTKARARLDVRAEGEWATELAQAALKTGLGGFASGAPAFLRSPDAALIRPDYLTLRESGAQAMEDWVNRLVEANRLNPSNGFNALSLAFLWIQKGDGQRAIEWADHAVGQLPQASLAHFSAALARCISAKPSARTKPFVEDILRHLARARRLTPCGAEVELLTALVVDHFYGARHLTPPVEPDHALRAGLNPQRPWRHSENLRVLDCEPPQLNRCTAGLVDIYTHPDRD